MEIGYLKYYLKKEYYKKIMEEINEKIVKDKNKNSYKCSVQNQEKWRQRQIDIFYRSGRPIFEDDYKKMLIRNNI